MKLEVKRFKMNSKATFGRLYVDGVFECLTLEDVVRPDGVKVWGETAIPAGAYRVIINLSPRFQKLMMRLLNVPGFDGILIHKGNKSADTHGCLLVGQVEAGEDFLARSTPAYNALYSKVKAALEAGGPVWITVTNEFPEAPHA